MTRKTVIITGAAGALGSELAFACSRSEWNVVMVDNDVPRLERAYDRITESGFAEPLLHPLDLATAGTEQFESMLEAVRSKPGGLDAVLHCAARFEALMLSEHIVPAEWLLAMQVNLNAAWLLSILSLPLLKQSARGQLYFLLDDLTRVGGPFWGPYGVSKHGLHALIGQLSRELKVTNVQVLGLDPGPFQSTLRSRAYFGEDVSTLPLPSVAAAKIMDYLEERCEPTGCIVSLAG